MRRAAMIAHHAQHVPGILRIAGEGAELLGHLRGGGIGDARHDGADRPGDGAGFSRVIGNAARHEQAANIGKAEPQRAVAIGEFRNRLARELRHGDGDFEHDGPEFHRMLEGFHVEAAIVLTKLDEIQRREVASRVVQEHIFRARIAGADRAGGRAGVPVIDGGVKLDAGVRARPGGMADGVPEIAGPEGTVLLIVGAPAQRPLTVIFHRLQEFVRHADGVVGVLAGNGQIGVRIPIRVIGAEVDVLVALPGELDHTLDVVFRHMRLAGGEHFALQGRVLLRAEAILIGAVAVDARLHDGVEVLAVDLGAGHQRGDLLFLDHLPVDELLDVRMVDIDDHHLGRAARGAARLDGARRPVADLEEAHQPRRFAAARQRFVLTAQRGEIGAGA